MKEADLYNPVKEWLKSQGCHRVYPEVPLMMHPVDVVGIGKELVIGVELKLSLTSGVIRQALPVQMACDRTYVSVATKPRDPSRATRHGLGVLRVVAGAVEVVADSGTERLFGSYRSELIKTCSEMSEEGIGGVPCLDGVGPAQDCKRRVDEYRKSHPDVTWKELYIAIPNHYASHESMRGALTTGLVLRAQWKALRKKERKERNMALNQA